MGAPPGCSDGREWLAALYYEDALEGFAWRELASMDGLIVSAA
jgi:hypothetical protein